ncbi:YqkE family protein [Paenibacillus sp. MBLB4367]|uniref:YqkE family protein n=1 Tax=Paenibacillus sp. MBLB4367 TaxID=3384767 RepID=UPI003907EAA7
MAKKPHKPAGRQPQAAEDKPATLKDMLRPDVLEKLKAQADALKAEEHNRAEEKRKQAEDARKAEQKRLENDFGHLLESSGMDWRKYK